MPHRLIPLITVTYHTAAIYVFLILMLRFAGRRQLGQLTVIDLIIIILLGSAVETAMVNADVSLPAGLVCACTLLVCDRLLAAGMLRSKRLRHLVTPGPLLLVHDGRLVEEHLYRAGLTREDVLEALREREEADLSHIRFAVLEADGEITVVPR